MNLRVSPHGGAMRRRGGGGRGPQRQTLGRRRAETEIFFFSSTPFRLTFVFLCLRLISDLYIILGSPNQKERLPTFPGGGALGLSPQGPPVTSLWDGPTLLWGY